MAGRKDTIKIKNKFFIFSIIFAIILIETLVLNTIQNKVYISKIQNNLKKTNNELSRIIKKYESDLYFYSKKIIKNKSDKNIQKVILEYQAANFYNQNNGAILLWINDKSIINSFGKEDILNQFKIFKNLCNSIPDKNISSLDIKTNGNIQNIFLNFGRNVTNKNGFIAGFILLQIDMKKLIANINKNKEAIFAIYDNTNDILIEKTNAFTISPINQKQNKILPIINNQNKYLFQSKTPIKNIALLAGIKKSKLNFSFNKIFNVYGFILILINLILISLALHLRKNKEVKKTQATIEELKNINDKIKKDLETKDKNINRIKKSKSLYEKFYSDIQTNIVKEVKPFIENINHISNQNGESLERKIDNNTLLNVVNSMSFLITKTLPNNQNNNEFCLINLINDCVNISDFEAVTNNVNINFSYNKESSIFISKPLLPTKQIIISILIFSIQNSKKNSTINLTIEEKLNTVNIIIVRDCFDFAPINNNSINIIGLSLENIKMMSKKLSFHMDYNELVVNEQNSILISIPKIKESSNEKYESKNVIQLF